MLILVLAIGLAIVFNTALKWAIEQARWYKMTHHYDGSCNTLYRPEEH